MGAATAALYVWQTAGFVGLLAMAGIFFGAAALIFWGLRQHLRNGPMPFADTIAEFKKDRACLRRQD